MGSGPSTQGHLGKHVGAAPAKARLGMAPAKARLPPACVSYMKAQRPGPAWLDGCVQASLRQITSSE